MDNNRTTVPIETLLAERDWVRWLARTLVADSNRADDLEQQTWLAAVERPPASGGSVRGWLATVLRRAASKGRRSSERRDRRDHGAARPEGERSTAEVVAEAELHHQVVRAVLDLEEPYRSTILLRFFENLPPRDVAARMDVPVETVRSRVQRGVALLRGRFEREHRGDRSSWLAAFLPLTIPRTSDAGPVAGSTAAVAGWRVIAAGCAAVVVGGGGVLWFTRSTNVPARPTSIARGDSDGSRARTGNSAIESGAGSSSSSELAAASRRTTGTVGSSARAPSAMGVLSGHVRRDRADGPPVAGARVVAVLRRATPGDSGTVETTSDAEGRFTFASLPLGEVMVFAGAHGLTTRGLASTSFEGFNPLAVTLEAAVSATVDIILVAGAAAAGRVVDPNGKPVARATVLAGLPEPSMKPRFTEARELPPWTTTTADDGTFRFDALPGEVNFDFEAVADEFAPGYRGAVAVPGAEAEAIEIRLPASRWIDVRVLDDESGAPIARAEVTVGDLGGQRIRSRTRRSDPWLADSEGRARVGPCVAADVFIRASLPTPFAAPVIASSQRVAGDEASIVLRLDLNQFDQMRNLADTKAQRLSVFGPDGSPIPNARSVAYSWGTRGGGGVVGGAVIAGRGSCGYSDPPSEFVDVYDARDVDGAPMSLGAAHVALPKDRQEVSVRLEPERRITGRVVSPQGAGIPGVLVCAQPDWFSTDAWPLTNLFHATARTDSLGSFQLRGLGNTRYRLSARVPTSLVADASTSVEAGSRDIVLTTRDSVRPVITLVDSSGHPLPDVAIGLLPHGSDPRDRARIGGDVDLLPLVVTDARGGATLGPCDPLARYLLTIEPSSSRPELKGEARDGWAPKDETLTLGTQRVLRGHVHDGQGRLVEGVEVLWATTRGGGRSTRVEADGSFVLRGVAKGEVILVPHWKEQPTTERNPQATTVPEGADDVDLVFDPGLLLVVRMESPLSRIPWAKLFVEGGDPKDSRGVNVMNDASARSDGKLRFRGLSRDRTYTLCISPVDGLSLIREGVRADAGELTVRLERGFELTGRVLVPDGATDVKVGFNDGRISANAEVAADGRFVIRGVPAGSYDVTAWIEVNGGRRQASTTIRAGESGDIDLRGP